MEPDQNMQEHHHTRTTPGEPLAPEIVPNAVHHEPGASTQAEDINIPLLTMVVAGFAVVLIVTIVSLQAWFYNASTSESDAKWRPDPALDALSRQYAHDLHDPADINPRIPGAKEANLRRIPINQAIDATVQQYANKENKQN